MWDTTGAQAAGVPPNIFYLVSENGLVSLKASALSYPVAGNNRILRLRFNMAPGGDAGPVGGPPPANYTFPVGSNIVIGTTATQPRVLGTAAMTVPATTCTPSNADTTLSVRMYNSLGQETSETAAGSTINRVQSNVYLRSSGALAVEVGPAVNLTTGAALETSRIDVTSPSLGKQFTADADITAGTFAVAIGQLQFRNRGTFRDATIGAVGTYAVGASLARLGPSTAVAGNVSVEKLNLRLLGNFNSAGYVYVSTTAACNTAIRQNNGDFREAALSAALPPSAAARAVVTNTSATFTDFNLAGVPVAATTWYSASANQRVYLCYMRDTSVAGSVIPASQFTLDTAASSVSHVAESGSPICGDLMYNLRQNGVQIDLRNVVAKTSPQYTEGWRSFVRIINTDESLTATVSAQVIKSDGTVLGSAVLAADLAPRGYRVFTTDNIEAALAGTTSAGYDATNGANYRLRLTSPTSSIRVQNYLFNPNAGTYLEASTTQGDQQPGNAATSNSVSEDSRK